MASRWQDRQLAWFLNVLIACYETRRPDDDGNHFVNRWEWQAAADLSDGDYDALFERAWNEDMISHTQTFRNEWGAEILSSDGYMLTDLARQFLGFIEIEEKQTLRLKQPIPEDLRWAVWERDNFTCRHCGARQHLSVDHIVAESRGGAMTLDNLQTLCRRCNSKKGAR